MNRLLRAAEWFLIGLMLCIVGWGLAQGAEVIAPSQSGPILIFDTPSGDQIRLYEERGNFCASVDPEGTRMGKLVVYHYRKNHPVAARSDTSVEGCYAIGDDIVYMIFEDGDRGKSALSKFHQPGVGPHDTVYHKSRGLY